MFYIDYVVIALCLKGINNERKAIPADWNVR